MRRRNTLIGSMLMVKGEADAMLCGTFGTHALHLHYIDQVIGLRPGVRHYAAMNALLLEGRTIFICDTYVTPDPDAEHIAEMTVLAAEEIRRFGIAPKVALLSGSNFGSIEELPSARKMRQALKLIAERAPEMEIEGEMHGDAALSDEIRHKAFPNSRLKGDANLLVMPTLDAANISFNLLKVASSEKRHHRPDPARRGAPRAYPHALCDRAAHRQHDRARGGRCQRAARARSKLCSDEGRAGLVLTGGGARAAYQVGVVKAVRDIPRQPGQEPVPDPVRHLGRRDQRDHAGGVRRRLSAAAWAISWKCGRTCTATTSTAPTPATSSAAARAGSAR
jgi:hypothetical protein